MNFFSKCQKLGILYLEQMSTKPSIYKFAAAVPDPTLPVNVEQRGQHWINYGLDNLYPQFITGLYEASAMNKTCVVSKHVYSVGEGLYCEDPAYDYLLNRANSDGETWNDVFQRACLDFIIFGGHAINTIFSTSGDKIVDLYNYDFNDIRSGNIDPDLDKVCWYYYSSDWTRWRRPLYRPRAIKSFDPAQGNTYPSQLLYDFDRTPGRKFYPVPSYSGGLTACQVDVSVDSFHYYNLKNGLNPSLFISMNNGIPSPEERQDIYQDLASVFSGVEGAGKYFLSFNIDKDHATEVTPIESANDDYYISLSQRLAQQILTSHRITSPLLLGIKDIGGNGLTNNAQEIEVAALHFQSTTIKPIQQRMLKTFNKLWSLAGNPGELKIKPLTIFNADGEQVGETIITE